MSGFHDSCVSAGAFEAVYAQCRRYKKLCEAVCQQLRQNPNGEAQLASVTEKLEEPHYVTANPDGTLSNVPAVAAVHTMPTPSVADCTHCKDVIENFGDGHPNPEGFMEWWGAGHHVCGHYDAGPAVIANEYRPPTMAEVGVLKQMSLELCWEIEKLPASTEQTALVTRAGAIHSKLQDLLYENCELKRSPVTGVAAEIRARAELSRGEMLRGSDTGKEE